MGVLGAAFGMGFAGRTVCRRGAWARSTSACPRSSPPASALAAAIITLLKLPESRSHAPTEAEAWLHPERLQADFAQAGARPAPAISFFTMAAFVMMESTIGIFLIKVFGYRAAAIGLLLRVRRDHHHRRAGRADRPADKRVGRLAAGDRRAVARRGGDVSAQRNRLVSNAPPAAARRCEQRDRTKPSTADDLIPDLQVLRSAGAGHGVSACITAWAAWHASSDRSSRGLPTASTSPARSSPPRELSSSPACGR